MKKLNNSESSEIIHPVQDNGVYTLNQKSFKVYTFIQHWQLRDLLTCPSNNTIIHPKRNSIHMFNIKTKQDECLQDNLSFTPISVDSRFGYLVLGGQTGLLMVQELKTGYTKLTSIGRGMNNSVSLYAMNRMTVCNNDQTVSILSIPDMEKIQTLNMPSAINYSAVSPDGKKMLMVSDQGVVYIYDINHKGVFSYNTEFKVSKEAGLSCAWSPSSDTFAITTQDGYVCVYSYESKQKLCQLCSTETRKTKKAPRSIKFSNGILNLLAYADHVSNIYIVDARTFETRQIIRLSPENEDCPITGLCFSPNSRSLYVGLEDKLVEFEIDTSTRRQFAAGRLIL